MSRKITKKIKVLQVIQPTDGGSALHVCQLLENFDTDTFELGLVAAESKVYQKICRKYQHNYYLISFTRSMNPIRNIKPLWQMYRVFRQQDFDVIHLHSTSAGLLGRFAAIGLKTRVIYTPHSPLYFQLTGMKQKLFYWAERLTMRLIDAVVLVSPSERDRVVNDKLVFDEKCIVIVNGIELPEVNKNTFEHPIITMVSRLERQKRHQDLIKAAPLVRKKFPNIEIRLIGEGSRRAELQRMINQLNASSYITLLGHRNDVDAQWSQASIAVQCSETEGLPYSILEAMAAGLPVIGTRVEGIVDLVDDENTGLFYEKGDYKQLALNMIFLLKNPTVARKYGQRARQIIEREYSVSNMLKRTEQIYVSE